MLSFSASSPLTLALMMILLPVVSLIAFRRKPRRS